MSNIATLIEAGDALTFKEVVAAEKNQFNTLDLTLDFTRRVLDPSTQDSGL